MSDTTTDPQLYSPSQVAALLGLATRTIRDHVRTGEIASVNVGKAGASRPTLRISANALNRFLEARAR